jgi:cytochrome c oxidase cbb3-type subunit III
MKFNLSFPAQIISRSGGVCFLCAGRRIILVRFMNSRFLLRSLSVAGFLWLTSVGLAAQGPGQASPASRRPTPAAAPQEFPRDQIEAGRTRFASQCGFCHGRDAAGGESGTDLTRSELVGADVRGDKLIPMIRSGRPDKGMPAFTLPDTDMAAIVAFIHDRRAQAATVEGNRRSVAAADLATGNAEAGRRYFDATCARCHSPAGDLKGLASRLQGLQLLQRMLYPRAGGRGGGPAPQRVTVTLPSGQTITGPLAYRDEFTVALTDANGWRRSWPTNQITFSVEDRLQAHADLLAKYTDEDMHDVLAYLQTLK